MISVVAENDEQADAANSTDANESAQLHATRSMDPRFQRNFAERLFPGPSKPMSDQVQRRIEGLLKALDANQQGNARRQHREGAERNDSGRTAVEGKQPQLPPSTPSPSNAATSEDITALHDTLEQQNELLRAILASQVDTQNDARSTAQNSRTFAWAGTAIALLTLIATVLSILAAINAA